jgi:hypothetical protein
MSLDSLVLDQNFAAMTATKKEATFVPIRKSGKQNWIAFSDRALDRMQVSILEVSEDRENYIVAPNLREELQGEWVAKVLVLCQTKQKTFFLWPIKLPDAEGKLDTWNQSGLEILGKYPNQWLRLCPNRESSSYEVLTPISEFEAPSWPDDPRKVFETAFKGRILDSVEHPVIKRLRGVA